jgi:hypothetical protein
MSIKERIVAESDKIAAVCQYLNGEFNPCSIDYHFDLGKMAHVFAIKATGSYTAVIQNEFLETKSTQEIPSILRKFLLAEHLRECNFPIVVTNSGLTD